MMWLLVLDAFCGGMFLGALIVSREVKSLAVKAAKEVLEKHGL